MSTATWKEELGGRIPPALRDEIDVFESQITMRKEGRIDESVFAETRLRRGVYGQRYDNAKRHDGLRERVLSFPERPSKGPGTAWDAPGMVRIKIPGGILNPQQLEVLAELAEDYSDGIAHATTRQDIQLHFVHIDDTPDLMRRLAAVGITTREACGNSVRNVTVCPSAGVCSTELFDVTPYALVCTDFLLGHPDAQDFGRKVKISFSGCRDKACALAKMHDIGFIAAERECATTGEKERGFEVYVGGGLGAVPHQAKLFSEFLPFSELLPMSQAICRVFARLGEKKNRARARLKFLVAKLGIESFVHLVREERATLPFDSRWTSWLEDIPLQGETPIRAAGAPFVRSSEAPGDFGDPPPALGFETWRRTNVEAQTQDGRILATVTLPLGDITSTQLRALADITRTYAGEDPTLRITVEQNLVMRWISSADLVALHRELKRAELAESGAGTISDLTACPGTDTCKLGIAASRGLAARLRQQFQEKAAAADVGAQRPYPRSVEALRIKMSGCFNSCGQHHVADLGFYGVSRKVGTHVVPHFQVVVGGKWQENAGAYGLAIGAVPSKRIPELVDHFTERYAAEQEPGESFSGFVARLGKSTIKAWLKDFSAVPAYEVDPTFYSDWGNPREFSLGDLGVGECAGQVISSADFGLAEAERVVFEAQINLDHENNHQASVNALNAMVEAAKALVKADGARLANEETKTIIGEFQTRFFETERFFDPFAKGKFARYLFRQHAFFEQDQPDTNAHSQSDARQNIEEAQLFIEAAHSCYARMS